MGLRREAPSDHLSLVKRCYFLLHYSLKCGTLLVSCCLGAQSTLARLGSKETRTQPPKGHHRAFPGGLASSILRGTDPAPGSLGARPKALPPPPESETQDSPLPPSLRPGTYTERAVTECDSDFSNCGTRYKCELCIAGEKAIAGGFLPLYRDRCAKACAQPGGLLTIERAFPWPQCFQSVAFCKAL